jgi:hypothetical protein
MNLAHTYRHDDRTGECSVCGYPAFNKGYHPNYQTSREAQLIDWIKQRGHGDTCNYWMKFHAKSGYICDCGLEELLGERFDPDNIDPYEDDWGL